MSLVPHLFLVCMRSYEDCGFAMHVCLSTWNNLIPAGWIFVTFFIVCVCVYVWKWEEGLLKSVSKIQVWLKLHFTWRLPTFVATLVENITVVAFVTKIAGVDFLVDKVKNLAVVAPAAMVTKVTVC